MGSENYKAERIWLVAFLEIAEFDLSIEVEAKMKAMGITIGDIDEIIVGGEMFWADRCEDGCHFAVRGRNCDEKEITVFGRFEASTMTLAVTDIV